MLPKMLGFSHVPTNVVLQDLLSVAAEGALSVGLGCGSVIWVCAKFALLESLLTEVLICTYEQLC